MLRTAFLISLASGIVAAVVLDGHQTPLFPGIEASSPALPSPAFHTFAIENMSDAHYYLHHLVIKALVGETSYVTLREGEIQRRQIEIDMYIRANNLCCAGYTPYARDPNRPLWIEFRNGRVFNADPQVVPMEIIHGLEELKKEGHARFDLDIGKGEVITALPVPERFLPYEIMDREIEEYSQARKRRYEERKAEEKEKILGGELSVRDIVVPDFGACVEILD